MERKGSAVSRGVVSCFWVAFLLMGLAGVSFSQEFPNKTITIVVGMEPGASVDVLARILAEEAKKVLGQDILIENKPGASHMVGLSYMLTQKPDGYTLFNGTDAPYIRVPHMLKLKFDPIAETVPIIFYGIFTHFILVPENSPLKNLRDFFVYAKENPGKLTFGNPGYGTVPYITMAGVELETGLKFSHIPFAGEPKEIAALLGGHLMAAGIAIESCIAQVEAGNLRALAVLQGDKRMSAFPNIPVMKEVAKDFGMKSSVIYPGFMIAAPKGTPGPVVNKLANAFEAARKSPKFQSYAKEHYIFQDNMPMVGDVLKNHLTTGFKDIGDLIQKLGIQKK